MLRSILSRDGNDALTVKLVRCMSFQRNLQRSDDSRVHKERLGVTLCGQISEKPIKTENGTVIVPLITRNAHDELRMKHRVLISPPILKNVPVDRLKEGTRIYVTGVINYLKFQSFEGRASQQGQILSTNIIPCEQNEEPSSDINDIVLFGRVKYAPTITENITFLKVSTKFFDRKEQTYKSNLHNVMIKDDNEMRDIANRLTVGAVLSIHGFLNTHFVRSEDGNFRGTYYVLPRLLVVCEPTAS